MEYDRKTIRKEVDKAMLDARNNAMVILGKKCAKFKKWDFVRLNCRLSSGCPFSKGQTLKIWGVPQMCEHTYEVNQMCTDGEKYWTISELDLDLSKESEYNKPTFLEKIFS